MNKNKKKGFTLIELIVVVSIILIFSSMLIPKVLGYQDKARKAKVVNTARQVFDTSMGSYTEEEGSFVKEKLLTNINSVTNLNLLETDIVVTDSKNIVVTFKSDEKTYTEKIESEKNKFTLADSSSTTIYTNE